MTASMPVFTDTVNQNFFIESLGGSQQPVSYLDAFPDTVYTKSIDSVLLTFAYALLGPAGVGFLETEYLKARLQIEQAGLSTTDLDACYTNPFAFARAALETYTVDAQASLLPAQQQAQILAGDASFRNRALAYFKAIRAGGTLQGLTLAAQSALNHPVELIENYRALYDQYMDIPLGLPYMGTTTQLNEIIVLPRQEVPTNAQQMISISGEPTSGWFTLTVPLGPAYQSIQANVTSITSTPANAATVTVPNSAQTPVGVYFSIPSSPFYAVVASVVSPTQITLASPPQSTSAWTLATGTYTAYVGNAQTPPLPYNATYGQIQAALWALPLVGNGDVTAVGGPLPDQPVVLSFAGNLADRPIPAIQFNLAPDSIAGIGGPSATAPQGSQLTNILNSPLPISGNVTVDQAGVSADSQAGYIPPGDEHLMMEVLDILRPVNSFVTTAQAQPVTHRQAANTVFAGQTATQVLRYETGNAGVTWPVLDNLHWIQNGVEHEAPRPTGYVSHHYQGFHNIVNMTAYTEAALSDSGYGSGAIQAGNVYWNTKVGPYTPSQAALFPFLQAYTDPAQQFSASQAEAVSPEPLIITTNIGGTGIVNDVYPADYFSLSGVPQLSTKQTFWGSAERVPSGNNPSVDYLEIDLGVAQAINYLSFDATNKPYLIDVAYDTMDQSPARHFVTVNILSNPPSITSLTYASSVTNPWTTVAIHFTNSMSQMIYARYLRIGFTRVPNNTVFAPPTSPLVPYSIEVKNLRVGRNIASDMARTLTM